MSVTPTGTIGVMMQKLANHLAASATFQAACGVSSAAAALRSIYWPYAPYQEVARPLLVVSPNDDGAETRVSGGASTLTLPSGAFQVIACLDNDPAYSESDNWILFDNFVYGIIADLKAVSGVSDNLNMTGFRIQPYTESHPTTVATGADAESNPHIWECAIIVEWGTL